MAYAVTLYVEGGDYDGQTYACGPFDTEQEAQGHADALDRFGQPDVHDLERDSDAIARLIS